MFSLLFDLSLPLSIFCRMVDHFLFFPKLLDSGKHVCKHMHGVAKVMHKPCRIVFQLL